MSTHFQLKGFSISELKTMRANVTHELASFETDHPITHDMDGNLIDRDEVAALLVELNGELVRRGELLQ